VSGEVEGWIRVYCLMPLARSPLGAASRYMFTHTHTHTRARTHTYTGCTYFPYIYIYIYIYFICIGGRWVLGAHIPGGESGTGLEPRR